MNQPRPVSHTHWYTFLIATGATAIAVEIAGLRFLAPVFGSSLPVWGSAIAVVLAGLAWGYTQGGRRAKERDVSILVFRYAALGSALFLWMPALFFLTIWLRNLYFEQGNSGYILLAFLLSYGALLIPSIVFGIVSPLAIQTEADRRQQPAGQVAGRVFALTTIGSLIGILVPSFITLPLLGSRATVWLFAGLTLALCLKIILDKHSQILWLAAAAVIVTLLLRQNDPATLFKKETRHQQVTVRQAGSRRTLAFDGNLGTQSVLASNTYTNGYWDYLAALPALLATDDTRISVLVIGAAASTTERQMQRFWQKRKTLQFTSVELDGELFEIANAYFDPPSRRTITADGRLFAASDSGQYDLIIIDAYARELTIPFHLATAEFFSEIKPRLAPGGILAMNVNAVSADTLWIRSLARTLQEHFPHVRLVHVPQSCNHLLLASHKPWETERLSQNSTSLVEPLIPAIRDSSSPLTDGLLLTDDRSPTDLLGLAALVHSSPHSSCS